MADIPTACRLTGRYVILDPLDTATDGKDLFAISHVGQARELFQYLPNGPFETVDAMCQFYDAWSAAPGVLAYVVRDASTALTLGSVSLMNIRADHGVVEIGNVWYAPSAQRTKANTESVYLLLRYCFDGCGFRRIEWKCDRRNRRSGMAALRLGFCFEGIFRKHMIVRGMNRDTAWFSMLDDQWPARRQALETWLYTASTESLSAVQAAQLPYET